MTAIGSLALALTISMYDAPTDRGYTVVEVCYEELCEHLIVLNRQLDGPIVEVWVQEAADRLEAARAN